METAGTQTIITQGISSTGTSAEAERLCRKQYTRWGKNDANLTESGGKKRKNVRAETLFTHNKCKKKTTKM